MDLQYIMPDAAERPDAVDLWARYSRTSASPAAAVALIRQFSETDVRDVLPAVRVPTLALRHRDDPANSLEWAEYVVSHIEGARLALVDGRHTQAWFSDDTSELAGVIEEFVTGRRTVVVGDRVLGTVVFLDIVGSTERAAAIGDQAWRAEIDSFRAAVRSELTRHGGHEIDTAGDGLFATFGGPAAAVRFALAAQSAVAPLGVGLRAGVHTGEIERVDADIRGLAVHIGARVMATAAPGEVLATSTVKDLTAGSGIIFEDAGEHQLKGVPDRWRLCRVVD
jgi:class 3 adenylate cyclase